MASENGWEPLHPAASQLEWVTVPGTNVRLQFLKGQPLVILRAFAADFNAYVEPLRDADSAAYTATNSVATSNHLNGTAMDLNWNSHRFHVSYDGFDAAKIATCRELLAYYESTMWWGQDWRSPIDCMHWNLNYNTYGSQHVARIDDFISRKIRADGFSTFRRGGTVPPPAPTPAPALSRADGYAVRIIAEGRRRGITPRGIQIALATGLVESNITVYANEKLPESLKLPHDAVGRDGLSVGIFQQQVKDTGNGWWWGDCATCMGVESSAGLFYDRLVHLDYNGSNSPGSYAQAVQKSAYPARYDQRFNEAVGLYNRLANTPTTPTGGDDLSAEAERQIAVIYRELTQRLPSRSPLRYLDQKAHYADGLVDTVAGMVLNVDGMTHVQYVRELAALRHPPTIALLREVAGAAGDSRYPDRQDDALLAQAILAEATAEPAAVSAAPAVDETDLAAVYTDLDRLRAENARLQAAAATSPAVIYRDTPTSTDLVPAAKTSGDIVGGVVDSQMDYTKHVLAMNAEERTGLIKSLQALDPSTGTQP